MKFKYRLISYINDAINMAIIDITFSRNKLDKDVAKTAIYNDYAWVFETYLTHNNLNDIEDEELRCMLRDIVNFGSTRCMKAFMANIDGNTARRIGVHAFVTHLRNLLESGQFSESLHLAKLLVPDFLMKSLRFFNARNEYHERDIISIIESATYSKTPKSIEWLRDVMVGDYTGLDTISYYIANCKVSSLALLQHVRDNNYDMVKTLLDYGFDIRVQHDAILSVAMRNHNHKIIELLFDHGAHVEGYGYAAVSKAIIYADHEVLDMILDHIPTDDLLHGMDKELAYKLVERCLMGEPDEMEADMLKGLLDKLKP